MRPSDGLLFIVGLFVRCAIYYIRFYSFVLLKIIAKIMSKLFSALRNKFWWRKLICLRLMYYVILLCFFCMRIKYYSMSALIKLRASFRFVWMAMFGNGQSVKQIWYLILLWFLINTPLLVQERHNDGSEQCTKLFVYLIVFTYYCRLCWGSTCCVLNI